MRSCACSSSGQPGAGNKKVRREARSFLYLTGFRSAHIQAGGKFFRGSTTFGARQGRSRPLHMARHRGFVPATSRFDHPRSTDQAGGLRPNGLLIRRLDFPARVPRPPEADGHGRSRRRRAILGHVGLLIDVARGTARGASRRSRKRSAAGPGTITSQVQTRRPPRHRRQARTPSDGPNQMDGTASSRSGRKVPPNRYAPVIP